MMDAETWMSAPRALEEGFIDSISYAAQPTPTGDPATDMAATVAAAIHGATRPRSVQLPAVAYSARRQLQITARAAENRAAAQKTNTTSTQATEAQRARLRLLSM